MVEGDPSPEVVGAVRSFKYKFEDQALVTAEELIHGLGGVASFSEHETFIKVCVGSVFEAACNHGLYLYLYPNAPAEKKTMLMPNFYRVSINGLKGQSCSMDTDIEIEERERRIGWAWENMPHIVDQVGSAIQQIWKETANLVEPSDKPRVDLEVVFQIGCFFDLHRPYPDTLEAVDEARRRYFKKWETIVDSGLLNLLKLN